MRCGQTFVPTNNTVGLSSKLQTSPDKDDVFGRFSLGSLDSIDIPRKANRHLSASAFGSTDQLQSSFAVVLDCASFAWQPASPEPQIAFRGREGVVLSGIDLAIQQGSLTVIVGEVGSGRSLKTRLILPPMKAEKNSSVDIENSP